MANGRNLYADLAAFRRQFINNETLDSTDTTEVERVLEAASRQVDAFVRRPDGFYSTIDTRYFHGTGLDYLPVPDLLAITTIKLDEDGNRVYEVTLSAATDYRAVREGYADEDALPSTRINLDPVNGQRSHFLDRPRLVEIVGRWGFTEEVERLSMAATLLDGTTNVMTTSSNGDLAQGQTLKLGAAEVVYISGGTASPWSVIRAVNGSEASGGTNMTIDRYMYPAEVREAALIYAGRMWKRRASGYGEQVAGTTLAGPSDPVAERLLREYVRWSSMVA